MSDPCIVGRLGGEKATGVYIHVDGNPQAMLPRLGQLVARDGIETVLATLARRRYGWAYLWPELDEGDAETNLGVPLHKGKVIEGYGFSYTIGPPMHGYNLDDARTHPLIGWAYFIDPAGGDIHWWDTRPAAPDTCHVATVWGRA
ncbi:hypothetical protein [Nocardia anaemiae]|uniref:hypothetical protein n=1 Tax=Nocardia anaemiae TaxID=263910 RepID=UPI0007A3980B|nr:hypothetical protein [Nocardia anaemiae]